MVARSLRLTVVAATAALLFAGCGGGSSLPSPSSAAPVPAPTSAQQQATTPATTPVPATGAPSDSARPEPANGAVNTLDGVKGAILQIESNGTFVDQQVGQVNNAAGRGSGFIIDPSGLAVTNNHVVTGAAFLKVWVGGDKENVRNAKILGASECSDLAVIQIEGGDAFPYLQWYKGKIDTGLDIYVAGFPLGDPEYTLLRGIISKAKANGDTTWASIDSVLEHDAAAVPGNSGGPVITKDGQVVGVHFAGDSAGQRFAVSRDEAMKVLPQLEKGESVTSIGVNGQAVNDGNGLSGIWVSSVKSGSAADNAGIKPGDIITRLEGLVLSTDGTMADYCDILRSHDMTDVLAVQVMRFSTKEILEGQLNGRQLAVTSSFADVVPAEGGGTNGGTDTGPTDYASYTTVQDDTGTLSMDVPKEWSDFRGGSWAYNNENIGVGMNASTNIDKWLSGFDVPGVFFGASKQLTGDVVATLDEQSAFQQENCTREGRYDYSTDELTGKYDYYQKCGGTDASALVLVAEPTDGSYRIVLNVTVLGQRDLAVADKIVQTFKVLKALP
jgi:serine protease Do